MSTIRGAKKRLTHDLLLTTAQDLFASRGYAATTIDDIATGAGTTRTTLYMHFSSKADMLQHLVTGVDAHFTAADDPPLAEVVRSGERVVIRAWLDQKLDQWIQNRPYLAMVRQSDSDPAISSLVERWNDDVISQMRRGLDAADRFDPESRDIRCTIAFGGLESLSRRYINAGGWGDLAREAAVDALTMVWSRLLADPQC